MTTLAEAGFHLMTEDQQIAFLKAREADAPKPGTLVMKVRHDDTGREIREFVGDKSAWVNQFKSPAFRMIKINKHARGPF